MSDTTRWLLPNGIHELLPEQARRVGIVVAGFWIFVRAGATSTLCRRWSSSVIHFWSASVRTSMNLRASSPIEKQENARSSCGYYPASGAHRCP